MLFRYVVFKPVWKFPEIGVPSQMLADTVYPSPACGNEARWQSQPRHGDKKIYRNLYKSSARSQKHRQRTVDVSTYSKVGIKVAHTLLTQGSAGPSILNDPVPRNSTSFASALDEFLHCPLNPKNGEQVVCTLCTSLKSNIFWNVLAVSPLRTRSRRRLVLIILTLPDDKLVLLITCRLWKPRPTQHQL